MVTVFQLWSLWQRGFTVLHPNVSWQRGSVQEEVSAACYSTLLNGNVILWLHSRRSCVAGPTVSAEGFLRERWCPVSSAVYVMATWKMFCSKISLKTKGTTDLFKTLEGSVCTVLRCLCPHCVGRFLVSVGVWWDWWMTSFLSHQITIKHKRS